MSTTAEAQRAPGPLPQLTAEDLVRLDAELWFRRYGVLKDKSGREIRFPKVKPTPVQLKMFDAYRRCRAAKRPCLMLVLKPRKDGASTGAQAITYHHLRSFPGRIGFQMGDQSGTSDTLFEMFRYFAQKDAFPWRHGPLLQDIADDITLGNGSYYGKKTAGSSNAGRGGTPQVVNATEVAHFPKDSGRDPALAYLNSAALDGEEGLAIWDTTPNGASGVFYQYWQDKTNDWIKIFVAWFENDEHALPFKDEAERAAFRKAPEWKNYEEEEEQERFGVTLEQLKWRRWCIKNKCRGDVEKFRQEYPSDEVSCWLGSGRPRFNMQVLEKMSQRAAGQPAPIRGEIILHEESGHVTLLPDDAGSVFVFEKPIVGCRYVGSADSATGEDQQEGGVTADPDWHSFGIWRDEYVDGNNGDYVPPKLVCYHYSQFEVEVAAKVMAAMSLFYGGCMVVPEVNACGLFITKRLIDLGVPVFKRPVKREMQGIDYAAGWRTDATTKKTIIDAMAGRLLKWKPEHPTVDILAPRIIEQCKTFVYQERGLPRAMPGHHDDDVMMTAIGLFNLSLADEMQQVIRKRHSIDDIMRRDGWRRM